MRLLKNPRNCAKCQAELVSEDRDHFTVCGEFAAGFAYEIKNPLAGIKIVLEVLSYELPNMIPNLPIVYLMYPDR